MKPTAVPLAPSSARNGPVEERMPSYAMSANRLTMPKATMNARPERLSKIVSLTVRPSRAKHSARRLRHGINDLLRNGFNLGFGERPVFRLDAHRDGKRLLALGNALAFIDVERADGFDQCAVCDLCRLHHIVHGDFSVHQEGEIALHRLERRRCERRPRLALGFRLGDRIEEYFECRDRTLEIECG